MENIRKLFVELLSSANNRTELFEIHKALENALAISVAEEYVKRFTDHEESKNDNN